MTEPGAPAPVPAPKPPEPWHQNLTLVVMSILVLGPLGLPVLWANKRLPLLVKIGATIIVIALTFLSIKVTIGLYERLRSELAQLNASLHP